MPESRTYTNVMVSITLRVQHFTNTVCTLIADCMVKTHTHTHTRTYIHTYKACDQLGANNHTPPSTSPYFLQFPADGQFLH